MRSIVVLLVEHGETTDGIDDLVRVSENITNVVDWTCRVDVPNEAHEYVFKTLRDGSMIVGTADWPVSAD